MLIRVPFKVIADADDLRYPYYLFRRMAASKPRMLPCPTEWNYTIAAGSTVAL